MEEKGLSPASGFSRFPHTVLDQDSKKERSLRKEGVRTKSQLPQEDVALRDLARGRYLVRGSSVPGSPQVPGFHFAPQSVSGPPAWILVTQRSFAFPLRVRFPDKPISVTAFSGVTPGLGFFPDPGGLGHGSLGPSLAAVGDPGPDPDPGW